MGMALGKEKRRRTEGKRNFAFVSWCGHGFTAFLFLFLENYLFWG